MAHIIVVHRKKEELHLYRYSVTRQRWKPAKEYRIAVGHVGLETPQGMFTIQSKVRHPHLTYQYPTSAWVPDSLKGVLIPDGDPRNPLAERWMGLTSGGVGIHGTFDRESIGQPASHGCVRMLPEDAVQLYDIVPKGTPVFIY